MAKGWRSVSLPQASSSGTKMMANNNGDVVIGNYGFSTSNIYKYSQGIFTLIANKQIIDVSISDNGNIAFITNDELLFEYIGTTLTQITSPNTTGFKCLGYLSNGDLVVINNYKIYKRTSGVWGSAILPDGNAGTLWLTLGVSKNGVISAAKWTAWQNLVFATNYGGSWNVSQLYTGSYSFMDQGGLTINNNGIYTLSAFSPLYAIATNKSGTFSHLPAIVVDLSSVSDINNAGVIIGGYLSQTSANAGLYLYETNQWVNISPATGTSLAYHDVSIIDNQDVYTVTGQDLRIYTEIPSSKSSMLL